MKIGLIGHSHSVCLLDAVGPWRDQFTLGPPKAKAGYSSAFDGWDAVEKGQAVIQLPNRRIGRFTVDLACAVISGGHPDYGLIGTEVGKDKTITISPTPTLLKICEGFADCDLIVSIVFGNELAGRIWIDVLPAYDFIEESLPGPLRAGAQPIDRRYINLALHEYVGRIQMTCLMIRRYCPRAGVAHTMPPPPIEDPPKLKFLEGFGEAMGKYGIVNPTLRLKWYRAYAAAMKATLNQAGIGLVPPPAAAFDERGFFQERLSSGLTHGNATYGAMVWEEIASNINVRPKQ